MSDAAAERQIFEQELAAATPHLVDLSIPERLELARQVEARVRHRVAQLNPVPAT